MPEYTDPYLADIIEKKFYSTPEVAGWFDITDAQLRYYIKPFEHYIFDDMTDNPTTATCDPAESAIDSQAPNDFIVERGVPSKGPQATTWHRGKRLHRQKPTRSHNRTRSIRLTCQ